MIGNYLDSVFFAGIVFGASAASLCFMGLPFVWAFFIP